MFAGPYDEEGTGMIKGLGIYRFLNKIWKLVYLLNSKIYQRK